MNTPTQEPEWSKQAAQAFAEEYCHNVDQLFLEGLRSAPDANVKDLLQGCIDTTSAGYGFKVG